LPAIFAGVSAGASLFSAISGNNAAKDQSKLQRQQLNQEAQLRQEQMARQDAYIAESKTKFEEETKRAQSLYDDLNAQIKDARMFGDQAQEKLLLEQQRQLQADFDQKSTILDRDIKEKETALAEMKKTETNLLGEQVKGNRALLGRSVAETDAAQAVNAADMARQEYGKRPEGLDAAVSDIEGQAKNAETEAARASGGNLSQGVRLSIALKKLREIGKTSAGMRQGQEQQTLNNRMALSGAIQSGARTRASLQDTNGELLANTERYYGNQAIGARSGYNSAALGLVGNKNAGLLGATTDAGNANIRRQDQQNSSLIGNREALSQNLNSASRGYLDSYSSGIAGQAANTNAAANSAAIRAGTAGANANAYYAAADKSASSFIDKMPGVVDKFQKLKKLPSDSDGNGGQNSDGSWG
jgi:hypothetical protein